MVPTLKARLSAVVLVLSVAPTLRAQQYVNLPGTQPGGLENATPLDSATPCGVSCHFSRDATTTSAMPYDGWVGSMMGNAMRDPLYLAALTVAEQDSPGIGDYCLRCHTPAGFVGGRTRSTPSASRGTELIAEDREGVTCDACHRMTETSNLGNAQYVLSPTDTRFGPYADIESKRHPGAVSTWLPQSRMCATCHDITNPAQPLRRADGSDTGQRFPLDTTYSEWARSSFATEGSATARTCQDCHMPRHGAEAYVASVNSAMLRENPRRHEFAGANAWALRVLGTMRNDTSTGEFYDPEVVPYYEAGARRAEAMLQTAVALEWREAPTEAVAGQSIEVVARITNRSGHRVPTGYADGRRVWLELAWLDEAQRETVVSGAYDMAEAHLTEDPQLKLYEAWHGRGGVRGEHIALHDSVVRDTRLPPQGYRPLPGHEPVGADYSGGEGGALRHWDDARYRITLPAGLQGRVTLRVRARYQSTTREYVEFLARENRTDNTGRDLLQRYQASGRAAPFTMVEARREIMLRAPVQDAGAPDVGIVDAGSDAGLDAGTTQPPSDEGCGCRVGTTHTARTLPRAMAALGALALVLRRRRRYPRSSVTAS